MGKLQIDILGTSLSLQAKEDASYLKRLLSYYRQIVDQLENSMDLKDSLQLSILAGLNLCDELYKEKTKNLKLKNASNLPFDTKQAENLLDQDKAEKITLTLIDKLDAVL